MRFNESEVGSQHTSDTSSDSDIPSSSSSSIPMLRCEIDNLGNLVGSLALMVLFLSVTGVGNQSCQLFGAAPLVLHGLLMRLLSIDSDSESKVYNDRFSRSTSV